jgi:hypothetical protein
MTSEIKVLSVELGWTKATNHASQSVAKELSASQEKTMLSIVVITVYNIYCKDEQRETQHDEVKAGPVALEFRELKPCVSSQRRMASSKSSCRILV